LKCRPTLDIEAAYQQRRARMVSKHATGSCEAATTSQAQDLMQD